MLLRLGISIITIGLMLLLPTSCLNFPGSSEPDSEHVNFEVFDTINTAVPVVYFSHDISAEGLVDIYKVLGRELTGKIAVKLNSGEPGGENYLKPDLIKNLVQELDGTIVEGNTAYGGGRTETEMHKQVLKDHGFTEIASTDILDEEGYISIPVSNGVHLTEDLVGANFDNYDSWIILSHFKGHAMGGFGGALKNMSIGIASPEGKVLIHSAGDRSKTSSFQVFRSFFTTPQNDFLESMAEAAGAVSEATGENIVYISIINNISVDCDCEADPADPTIEDIGIMASLDPVALDQACVDQIYNAKDGQDVVERIETRNGERILKHAADLGIGSREYRILHVD